MQYRFTTQDIQEIQESVDWRLKNVNIDMRVAPRHTNYDILFNGLKAEMAFARLMGVPFVSRIPVSGDKGVDFHLLGKAIQIKYSTTHGVYFRKSYGGCKADLIVMISPVGDGCPTSDVRFDGWTTKEYFLAHCVDKDFNKAGKPVQYLHKNHLRPMSEFVELMTKNSNN